MCGRYASSRNPDDLVEQFEIEENDLDPGTDPDDPAADPVVPDKVTLTGYNIAPTDTVPIVLERVLSPVTVEREKGESEPGESVQAGPHGQTVPDQPTRVVRRLRPLTWGLVPSWSKDRTGGARMINARAESLLEKPAFKKAAERDPDSGRAMLQAPPPGRFVTLPVSTRVNSVRNDGPELLEPAPQDQLIGVLDPATGELIGGPAEKLAEPLF